MADDGRCLNFCTYLALSLAMGYILLLLLQLENFGQRYMVTISGAPLPPKAAERGTMGKEIW